MTKETIESALDVAVDALKRRATVLQGQDPDVANAVLVLASKLTEEMLAPKRKAELVSRQAREDWL